MRALALATAAFALAGAGADLPVDVVRCGQIICLKNEYCSDLHAKQCMPCSNVCEPTSNNYVPQTCAEYCQDYIHNVRFVNATIIDTLTKRVQNVTILACVALIIALSLLTLLGTIMVRKLSKQKHLFWRFTKRSASGKKVGAADDPESGNKAAAVAAAAALQLPVTGPGPGTGAADDSPPPPSGALSRSVSRDVATPATTSTPLSRPRHPSEDTTLDYAYDNPALAPSPSPGKEHAPPLTNSTALTASAGATPSPPTVGFGGRKESSF